MGKQTAELFRAASTLSLLLQPLHLHQRLLTNFPLFTSPFSIFTLASAPRYSLGCSATLYPIPGTFPFSTSTYVDWRKASITPYKRIKPAGSVSAPSTTANEPGEGIP